MNLQQLEYFLAAARLGSFSAAADELHLAQPSVSEPVRRLEAELGLRLFQRAGRGLVLTDAGRTLRPHAEAVLEQLREARESVVAVRELRGGTASFGTFGTAGEYLGADLIAEFRRRHPKVRVRILSLNSAEAAEDVRAGRLEAAIVALPIDDEGLSVRPVAEDELVFVSADAGRLRRPMTIERLAGTQLILPDASYGLADPTRRLLSELAQRAGVTIRPDVDVEEQSTAIELAAAGTGDTVAWRGLLHGGRRKPPARLGWVPFSPRLALTLAFVFRRGAPLSPAARAMVELVEVRLEDTRRRIEGTPPRRMPG
ncbi:MAG: LysR family transcriptional regulator [Solirubrobacteraceae bacterium]|nr:LysR family transcriptional regulator [Solirubrobacteraceae bacterium]